MKLLQVLTALLSITTSSAFVALVQQKPMIGSLSNGHDDIMGVQILGRQSTSLYQKISKKRRKQLGIQDDEDEYDLGFALDNNTDPLISKIIAGSFILVMIALLTVGLIIPLTTDYGEGVCNPVLTAGRC